jgi:glycosyltransferase involved in cell wall biosynthesis
MEPKVRVQDIVNTDHAALHFLAARVNWINQHTEFENDVICSPGPHLERVRISGGRVTPLDIPRGLSPRGVAGLLLRVLRHLRATSYTIVHTHNSITGAVGRIAARLARVPLTIHTTHGFHFHQNMPALRRVPYVAAERWLARCCDLLLCQNEEEIADIRALGINPRQGVHHVGNGIELTQFARRPSAPANPRPVVLCVARLEPVKNHGMLFDALERLRAYAPVVQLVGDGPSQRQYEAEAARRGLDGMLRFLGYRYDVPALTAAADVVVLTSLKEGIPRAIMQAMAVGVPVVATDVKGTREVVRDGRTGYLVPLGDAAALAARLQALFDSPQLRRELGDAAAAHAHAHFDEEVVVRRLVAIYRHALTVRGLATRSDPALAGELLQPERGNA